jgi:hypothetical protein
MEESKVSTDKERPCASGTNSSQSGTTSKSTDARHAASTQLGPFLIGTPDAWMREGDVGDNFITPYTYERYPALQSIYLIPLYRRATQPESTSMLADYAKITNAWDGRHVWTIGGIEFVELRDVVEVVGRRDMGRFVPWGCRYYSQADSICNKCGKDHYDEQEHFEHWVKNEHPLSWPNARLDGSVKNGNGVYYNQGLADMWAAWKKRASL